MQMIIRIILHRGPFPPPYRHPSHMQHTCSLQDQLCLRQLHTALLQPNRDLRITAPIPTPTAFNILELSDIFSFVMIQILCKRFTVVVIENHEKFEKCSKHQTPKTKFTPTPSSNRSKSPPYQYCSYSLYPQKCLIPPHLQVSPKKAPTIPPSRSPLSPPLSPLLSPHPHPPLKSSIHY